MIFKLIRTDSDEARKIELAIGTHVFGRGIFLDCDDKRVSRKHGQLNVTEDTVTLKSLHKNPCFYIKKSTDEVIILKENSTAELNNGDKFGLLPTSYWYEVLHCNISPLRDIDNIENASGNINDLIVNTNGNDKIVNENGSIKDENADDNKADFDDDDSAMLEFDLNETTRIAERPESPSMIHPENYSETLPKSPSPSQTQIYNMTGPPNSSPAKRPHAEPSGEQGSSVQSESGLGNQGISEGVEVKKIKTEPEDVGGPSSDHPGPSRDQPIKQEPPPSPVKPPAAGPTHNNTLPLRERCFYGAQCYRVNPLHKAQFSHPSDSDWGSEPLGQCPWGAACSRPDPRHWSSHAHPPGVNPPRHQDGLAGKKGRRKVKQRSDSSREASPVPDLNLPAKRARKTVKRESWSGSESENEYDMEDPFMTDGDSDEWQPSQDSKPTQNSDDV